jgi:hypothetical protein
VRVLRRRPQSQLKYSVRGAGAAPKIKMNKERGLAPNSGEQLVGGSSAFDNTEQVNSGDSLVG